MTPRLWRPLTWLTAMTLIVLPIAAVVNGWIGREHWPLTAVRIQPAPGQGPLERINLAELKHAIAPFVAQGYFAIDLNAAQQALREVPWVATAQLRKYWPDILEVQLSEQRPFARWGDDQVLSEQGQIFSAEGVVLPDGLPWLDGPATQTLEVVRRYTQARDLFAPAGIEIDQIKLDARGSWQLTLSNGTQVILGSRDTSRRLRRFVRMLPGLLAQHPTPLQRADLRYSNGFSLSWMPTDPHAPLTPSLPPST